MSKLHDTANLFAYGGKGYSHSGAFHATSTEAHSYAEKIAWRSGSGNVHVTNNWWSVTTARHVNAIRRALERAGYTIMDHGTSDGPDAFTTYTK